jgi:hypothetical protein
MRRLFRNLLWLQLLSVTAAYVLNSKTTDSSAPMKSSVSFISANDAAFQFTGRIDARDPSTPVLIWQGTRVEVDFEGNVLALRFGVSRGVCFFDLEIDGLTSVIAVKEGTVPVRVEYAKPL